MPGVALPTPVPLRQQHSRLWRWMQVRPGMRREEQPRQSVLFTEGSLGAEERQSAPARAPGSSRQPVPYCRRTSRFAMVFSVWQ